MSKTKVTMKKMVKKRRKDCSAACIRMKIWMMIKLKKNLPIK